MNQCKNCRLGFNEPLDAAGHCPQCAAELAPPPPAKEDDEMVKLRRQLAESDQRLQMAISSTRQPAQPATPPSESDVNKQFFAAPARVTAEIAYAAAQQVAQQNDAASHETLVSVAKSQAREGTDPEAFDKYKAEIEQQAMAFSGNNPAYLKNITLWKNAAEVVFGRHFREAKAAVREAAESTRAPAFRVGDGPAPPSPRGAQAPKPEALPEEAKQIARKLRITEDQMRKGIEMYNNQGNENDPSQPSSWDPYFTFDGKTGRHMKKAS
jgi:hypothetical protein